MAGRSERKIAPLSLSNIKDLPQRCRDCAYWVSEQKLPPECGAARNESAKSEWIASASETWGQCGSLLYIDTELVACALYGPATAFPQTSHFASGPISADAVFLSCLFVREDMRRHGVAKALLQSIEKTLYTRNVKAIEAIAKTSGTQDLSALGPAEFYLQNGFYIKHDHPLYPLVRLDLKTALPWQIDLEGILQSLRVPLRAGRAPAPSA